MVGHFWEKLHPLNLAVLPVRGIEWSDIEEPRRVMDTSPEQGNPSTGVLTDRDIYMTAYTQGRHSAECRYQGYVP